MCRSLMMAELPEDVVVDILSRLSAKTILHCRCVCKSWHGIITNSNYFANLHLSRSQSGLIIHKTLYCHREYQPITPRHDPGFLKFVEMEDESDYHTFLRDPLIGLDLKLGVAFQNSELDLVGSVNGLVCLWQFGDRNDNIYICNPITREYMILPKQQAYYTELYFANVVYGFGVSSSTREYKVVRIFQVPPLTLAPRPSLLEGEVYTLGMGKWRSLGRVPYWLGEIHGLFLNGYIHWLVCDQESPEKICSFDMEKEAFSLVPSPPATDDVLVFQDLGMLGGCLCQYQCSESDFVIWVMKEYGNKKSWTKDISITTMSEDPLYCLNWETINVVKDLKDGTILMMNSEGALFAYCPRRKLKEDVGIFPSYFTALAYVPSFIKLRNFSHENVCTFQ